MRVKTNHNYKKRLVIQDITILKNTSQNRTYNNSTGNQLIKLLPFTGPYFEYKIDFLYTFNNNSAEPIITIAPKTTSATQDALNWIKGMGFDPSALNIHILTPSNNQEGQ